MIAFLKITPEYSEEINPKPPINSLGYSPLFEWLQEEEKNIVIKRHKSIDSLDVFIKRLDCDKITTSLQNIIFYINTTHFTLKKRVLNTENF
jgi:hypothetical protein